MSKIIYFEDGAGGLLSISPAWDARSRRDIETAAAWTETIEHEAVLNDEGEIVTPAWTETIEHPAITRKETDDEVIARNAAFVPDGADWAAFDAGTPMDEVYAAFPGTAPPPPPPITVTPYQAREALRLAGQLATVEALVEQQGGQVYNAWHYAPAFVEDHPVIISLSQALGWTADQRHALFVTAKGISL